MFCAFCFRDRLQEFLYRIRVCSFLSAPLFTCVGAGSSFSSSLSASVATMDQSLHALTMFLWNTSAWDVQLPFNEMSASEEIAKLQALCSFTPCLVVFFQNLTDAESLDFLLSASSNFSTMKMFFACHPFEPPMSIKRPNLSMKMSKKQSTMA